MTKKRGVKKKKKRKQQNATIFLGNKIPNTWNKKGVFLTSSARMNALLPNLSEFDVIKANT